MISVVVSPHVIILTCNWWHFPAGLHEHLITDTWHSIWICSSHDTLMIRVHAAKIFGRASSVFGLDLGWSCDFALLYYMQYSSRCREDTPGHLYSHRDRYGLFGKLVMTWYVASYPVQARRMLAGTSIKTRRDVESEITWVMWCW